MKMFKVNSESFINLEKVVAVDYSMKVVSFLFENGKIIHYNLSPSESWEDFMECLAASQN